MDMYRYANSCVRMSKNATLNDIFIRRVKEILGKRTAYWLAQATELPPATLSRILSGKMNPTIKMVGVIADGLKVRASDLLHDGKEDAIPPDILVMLADQPDFVYEAVRGMLAPLRKK